METNTKLTYTLRPMTTGRISKACGVDLSQVRRWMDNKILPYFNLPSLKTAPYTTRRSRVEDVVAMMTKYSIPLVIKYLSREEIEAFRRADNQGAEQ